jgi:multiple antibiotic resistance protein
MNNLAYAFTIMFVTLGPIKIIPPFFLMTLTASRRTIFTLALKSTIVATILSLFIVFVATGMMLKWRVSVDAIVIAGGIMLLTTAIKSVSSFTLIETPPAAAAGTATAMGPLPWLGKPVLSPIVIPLIIPPIGVAVILFFAGAALGDDNAMRLELAGVLVGIMATNFLGMLLAHRIMRLIGVPVLQVIGWVLTTLQAGLAVEAIIGALRRLQVIP